MQIIETCPKCGHDLMNIMLTTNPPIPKKECWNCGWSWTGNQEQEEVIRVPFANNYFEQSPCNNCSNNPKNGGSGICHCILGLPKVT